MDFERIITHNDFDGVVSAAICSHVYGCDRLIFTGPNSIARAEISIDRRDVVCDLPYPLECGMWFDHHPGNREAVLLRGIDPDTIPGRFEERPSCARVIYEYFTDNEIVQPSQFADKEIVQSSHIADKEIMLQAHFAETVPEADTIDSFNYRSVEEWRMETPGKLVDMSLKAYFPSPREQTKYLNRLTELVRDSALGDVLLDKEVSFNLERYREEEKRMVSFIEKSVSFMPQDSAKEIVVLDFTHHKRRPHVIRNLAYLVHPDALGALALNPLFRGGRKTNDFSVSMSVSMNLKGRDHAKDIGDIMRSLNIGDGHRGAASGTVRCGSKDEMLRTKKRILSEIWDLWKSMPG